MLTPRDKQEYLVLSLVGPLPVGSGAVKVALERSGVSISEATVGRLLRELDTRGYTERHAFRGRTLTSKGKDRLSELEFLKASEHNTQSLLCILASTGKKELLDLLIARRAMESEAARLAAGNITSAEVDQLRVIVHRHQEITDSGQVGAEQDSDFHRIILMCSRNPVLIAAMELMKQHPRLSELLHYIRNKVQSAVVKDHVFILDALERRDPEAAREAMVVHMDNLISAVRAYWTQYHEQAVRDLTLTEA